MAITQIGWTARYSPSGVLFPGYSQNFWLGCSHKTYITEDGKKAIDPACMHCYAQGTMEHRFHRVEWGDDNPRDRTSEENWKKPYRWNRKAEKLGFRLAVFTESLADLFDSHAPETWFLDAWQVIRETPNLEWLILTKRIEVVQDWIYRKYKLLNPGETLPYIRFGTTIGHRALYEERASQLHQLHQIGWSTFLSCEPLLSPLEFDFNRYPCDWVIVGGESDQPNKPARPCHLEHMELAVEQCIAANIPSFVKQAGDNPFYQGKPFSLQSSKGEEISELPASLQVRELPPTIPLAPGCQNAIASTAII